MMEAANESFQRRVFRLMLAAAFTLLAAIAMVGYLFTIASILAEARSDLEIIADIAADRAGRALSTLESDTQRLANLPIIVNALSDTDERTSYLAPILLSAQQGSGGLDWVGLIDHRGKVLSARGKQPFLASERDPAIPENVALALLPGVVRPVHEAVMRSARSTQTVLPGPTGDVLVIVHPVIYPPTKTTEGSVVVIVDLMHALVPAPVLRGFRISAGRLTPAAQGTDEAWSPVRAGSEYFVGRRAITGSSASGNSSVAISARVEPQLIWNPIARFTLLFLASIALLTILCLNLSKRLAQVLSEPLVRLTREVETYDLDATQLTKFSETDNAPLELRNLSDAYRNLVQILHERNSLLATRVDATVAQAMQREDQFSAILNFSKDGFAVIGSDRMVDYVNPAFERMTGIMSSAAVGRSTDFLVSQLRAISDPSFPWPALLSQVSSEGMEKPEAQHSSTPLRLLAPNPAYLVPTLWNSEKWAGTVVIHLRDATREMELDQMKSRFIATAAHELRTPLAAIYGFAQLLELDAKPDEDTAESIRHICEQCDLLSRMLDDLLDLARLEAGAQNGPEGVPVSVAELIRSTLPALAAVRGERDITLAPLSDDVKVIGDPGQLRKILLNFLSNACKYSPDRSRIRIEVLRHDGAAGNAMPKIGLRVTDEGKGMSEEELEHAFERFWRADPAGTIPGTGLGLNIARTVVEQHGGSIELHSEPGRGTEITAWLPAA